MSEELDPSEFVQRIRQLGEQRDQQDAERVRKLEEEIIQGRSERLARRAERARSLSPDKPTTPQSLRSAADTPRDVQERAADTPTPTMEPSSQESAREDSLQRLTGSPAQVLEDVEPKKPTPNAAALGRSGTLSWQRRPQSGVGSMRRPRSGVSTSPERNSTTSPRDTPEPSSPTRPLSRNQIAQSLGAKDPSWFKQTPDRGIGSAAYRKNQDDNASDASPISGKRQLPGMSRDSTAEPEATPSSPPPDSFRSSSPSRTSSGRGSAALSNRFSTNTSVSGGDVEPAGKLKSPLPMLDSQKFAPPEQGSSADGGDQSGSVRGLAMSPTQGRISPERAPSPTKGMGGFVQSAMMKRSDSVNKRWSTQTPQGISRTNSTLSNRGSGNISGYGSISKGDSRPSSLSRDNSMEPSSRPGSSSSNLTITKDAEKESKGEFVKPALPHHSRSKSVASTFSEKEAPQDDTSPPSPSKRWSPTKSSWLENALKKPESPKPKQPPPQQPSWMADLNRKKQERGSVDLGKDSPLHSPPGVTPGSGRSSPIKDVQLRPVSLRQTETPKKEVLETIQASPKPKPAVSPKPPISVKEEIKEPEKPEPEPEPESQPEPIEEPKEKIPPAVSKPSISASRFSKDSPSASPAAKSKPETPPKKDFRAGLKSRVNAFEAKQRESDPKNELQNVFGRLKKTETKNYVAPDTFKDNIMRGKNALNITGGPKPTVRKDEFKESLVSSRQAMLAKAKEEGSVLHKKGDSSSQPAPTPEALAKRKVLGRSDSIKEPPPPPKETQSTPEAIARKKSLRTSKPVIPEKKVQPEPSPAPSPAPKEPVKSSKLANRFNPALAGILARGPPSMSPSPAPSAGGSSASTPQPVEAEKKGPAPELTHMTKGRARGPKRRAPAKQAATAEKEKSVPKEAPVAAVPLVKAKEVLPSNEVSKTEESPEEAPVSRTPARESFKAKPSTPLKSPDLPRKIEKPASPELPRKPASIEINRRVSSEVKETPKKPIQTEVAESPKPAVVSPKPSSPKNPAFRSSRPLPTPPIKPEIQKEPASALKEIPTPNKDNSPVKEAHSPEKSSFPSVKGATAIWGRQAASPSSTPTRTKSPIKLPTRSDEQEAMKDAGLIRPEEKVEPEQPRQPKPKPVGLGLGSLGSFGGLVAARTRESSPPKSATAKSFPISPPASGDRPQSMPFKASPMPEKTDDLFADFFDEPPVSGELPENINTIQILNSPPLDLGPGGKIRTLRKQIQEITGDGKLTPLPMQEEHVLYQDSMYMCTHIFGDPKGAKQTEVYLWAGNGVSESTLEDVQLFAKNIAKQNQGKLIVLRQGKESPYFFEALGGIVITRRGSRPANTEYMLCGRRHLGHIAFDEVDFALKSLCSGFAYLISTQAGRLGKLYLWKGRGCSAEELSAARLMGMDLNATGDIIEVDEGSEPPQLFDVFPPDAMPSNLKGKGPAVPRSATHWQYKASTDKYRARLYKIEQQQGSTGWGGGLQVSSFFAPLLRRPSWNASSDSSRPQTPSTPKSPLPPATTKVVEIMPFCQKDLEPEYIYVLDAFFEMYIIVGSLSRSQSAAFSTALMFAQEYSILAVSEEDRPFMPVTTIVLEGVPRDMKTVFRFWDDALIPAAGLMQGKLGRGKSLRIMGLQKAIEATRR